VGQKENKVESVCEDKLSKGEEGTAGERERKESRKVKPEGDQTYQRERISFNEPKKNREEGKVRGMGWHLKEERKKRKKVGQANLVDKLVAKNFRTRAQDGITKRIKQKLRAWCSSRR